MIMCFFSSSDRIPWDSVKQCMNFLGMAIYTYMILSASAAMNYYHYPLPPEYRDNLTIQSSYLWLIIEQLVFIGTLVSNVMYLALRSLFRTQIVLDQKDTKRQLPNVDTVIASQEVINAFNAQFVPFFVNNFFYIVPTGNNGELQAQLTIILISNSVSLMAIVYLIFVPWKRGPEWYLKFSPMVFFFMMYLNYLILPIFNIALSVYFTVNPRYDLKQMPLESWVVFFTIICFSRLVEYYASIKKLVMDDARIHIQKRREQQQRQ